MIEPSEDPPLTFQSSARLRIAVALIGASSAILIAPTIIPNPIFQVIAALSAGIVLWNHRLIGHFYFSMAKQAFSEFRVKTTQPWPIRVSGLLLCGIILWLLINIVVNPVKIGLLDYDIFPVILGFFTILLVLPPLYAAALKAGTWFEAKSRWFHYIFLTIVLALCFYTQLMVATAIYLFPGWDAGAVLGNAFGLADGSIKTLAPDYFAKYPNNIFLTLLLYAFSRLMLGVGVTDLLFASIVLNALILLCGVLFTYLVARRLAGTGAAILSLLPSIIFVTISPWIAVPYSDTFGLLFPVLLMYLYLRAQNVTRFWPRTGLWAAIGVAGVIGCNIKPTVVFVLVGITAVTLSYTLRNPRSLRRTGTAVAAIAVAVSVFGAGSGALTQLERTSAVIPFDITDNPQAVPFTHFLKMGATGSGGFNEADVLETSSITDPHDRFMNGLNVYMERVRAMGPIGYLEFLSRKGLSTFGDGTFGMWSEGVVSMQDDPFLSKDSLSRAIQDYFWVKGDNFRFTTGFLQAFWFVLLFLVAAPVVLRGGRMFTSSTGVMRMSLLGLVIFQLFFETRARYLYLYMPFFILLAILTLDAVMARLTPAWRPSQLVKARQITGKRQNSA